MIAEKAYLGSTEVDLWLGEIWLTATGTPTANAFSFTLSSETTTSAGVYKSDGTLIRTLWGGVVYPAGTHVEYWDGLNDDSTTADAGTYHVELLKNNIAATWQGAAIGNTSTNLTGSDLFRASNVPQGIAIAGGKLFYGTEYIEKNNGQFVTDLSDIGTTQTVVPGGENYGTNQVTTHVCADATNVYWAGLLDNISFVFATKVSDNSITTFTNGVLVTHSSSMDYTSALSVNTSSNYIIGIAVQPTGNYLFVARSGSLQVIHKTNGLLTQTIALIGLGAIATDNNNKLWVTEGTTITRYTVNSGGTITSDGVAISGSVKVGALAVSPDNSKVAVVDNDSTQHVVNFYSGTTGAYINTLGTVGGYNTSSTVTDYKFMLTDTVLRYTPSAPGYRSGIAYNSDGSYWLIDPGNCRMQHYNSSNVFIDRIMYVPFHYVVQTDANNATRLFEGYREFTVDYTSGIHSAWTLSKNWGGVLSSENFDDFRKLQNIVTLSNGKTYGLTLRTATGQANGFYDVNVFELVNGGVARWTNISDFAKNTAINKNGAKITRTVIFDGGGIITSDVVRSYALTGFDGSNNPQWSSTATVLATTPTGLTADAPLEFERMTNKITSDNKVIFYKHVHLTGGTGNDYHLNAIGVGGNSWRWKNHRGTLRTYFGDYPLNGQFDNGNGVAGPGGDAGGFIEVQDDLIITSYHGEFWKTEQANFFNLFYKNGLPLKVFGTTRKEYGTERNAYGAAGNAVTGSLVKIDSDTMYLYHCDEGEHSGVARWKIEGISTVSAQTLSLQNLVIPSKPYADLTVNLVKDTLLTAYSGWTLSHATDSDWTVQLGGQTPNTFLPADIYAVFTKASGNERYIDRSLGTNTGLTSWKVQADVNFQNGASPFGIANGSFVEVLDNSNRVIAKFYPNTTDFTNYTFYGNGVSIASGNANFYNGKVYRFRPLVITVSGSSITFNYDGNSITTSTLSEGLANIQNPTKIRFRCATVSGGADVRTISVKDLRFYNS